MKGTLWWLRCRGPSIIVDRRSKTSFVKVQGTMRQVFCKDWRRPARAVSNRRLLRRYRPQSAVNCSTLWERAVRSPPNTSQVSLVIFLSEFFVIGKFYKGLLCCIQVLSPSSETCLSSLTFSQPCSIKVNTTPYVWMSEPKGSAKNREVPLLRPIHGNL